MTGEALVCNACRQVLSYADYRTGYCEKTADTYHVVEGREMKIIITTEGGDPRPPQTPDLRTVRCKILRDGRVEMVDLHECALWLHGMADANAHRSASWALALKFAADALQHVASLAQTPPASPPEQIAEARYRQLVEDVLDEYHDEWASKEASDRCEDCGAVVMCRFHSLLSALSGSAWTNAAIDRNEAPPKTREQTAEIFIVAIVAIVVLTLLIVADKRNVRSGKMRP